MNNVRGDNIHADNGTKMFHVDARRALKMAVSREVEAIAQQTKLTSPTYVCAYATIPFQW